MPELCNSQLVESLASALETMAFISLMPPEEQVQPPTDPVLVSIEYRGPHHGRVELVTSHDLGKMLVENTVGCDPGEDAPNPTDALVELVNITCGMLLKNNWPNDRFDVAVPQVQPFDVHTHWQNFLTHSGCDVLLAEGFVVAIRNIEG